MIRQIAADTGQSAQMLRAMNRRRFNADSISLTDDINDDLSDSARQALEDHQLEQERMQRDRLDTMQHNDLAARMARMHVPPSSILSASFPSSEPAPPPPPPPPASSTSCVSTNCFYAI